MCGELYLSGAARNVKGRIRLPLTEEGRSVTDLVSRMEGKHVQKVIYIKLEDIIATDSVDQWVVPK